MNKTEELNITDIPQATHDVVCEHLALYTVGLQKIVNTPQGESMRLLGSGTLVEIAGLPCILTAQHVLKEFYQDDRLNLLTSFSGAMRRHVFDTIHLEIHRIAKGDDDSAGPDICLIVLPAAGIGYLRSEKNFYNIDKCINRFRDGFPDRSMGFWFNCGVLGAGEKELGNIDGFVNVKGYWGLCGVSANPNEHEQDGYDYLDVRIEHGSNNEELPSTLGGMSGSGIWQVLMRKNSEREITPEEYILSGVTFYETATVNNKKLLRGHGRKTVYHCVPEYLRLQRKL